VRADISNNIEYKWRQFIELTWISNPNAVNYSGYNVQDVTGLNALGAPEPFPDPNRTVGTYYDTLVGSPGHTSQDFIKAARQQSKDNWNPALTANAVNNYIRAGFGK